MGIESLSELLPHAVSASGDRSGVIDRDGSKLRWSEVDSASASLAGRLQASGVARGDRVIVLHPKSAASFIAMHAVIRAGGVAVPLDPLGASGQLRSVIERIEPAAAIGAGANMKRLILDSLAALPIPLFVNGGVEALVEAGIGPDRVESFEEAIAHKQAVLPAMNPDDLAYIIFTSGSTGEPKGIVHTHASAVAYAERAVEHHRLTADSRLAGTPPLHFDMSTLELYAVPYAGSTTVTIGEAEQRFPATLSRRFEERQVTHLYAVPYQLRQLQQLGEIHDRDLAAITQVAYGGEPFATGALHELGVLLPGVEFLNVYGPAEVNACTTYSFAAPEPDDPPVPIGPAWRGMRLRVVDDAGHDLPAFERGQLLVSSPQQMQGYWRDPELTSASLSDFDGRSWYATGDVAMLDGDGVAHFYGRRDHQVKIRGVRLELEAIETILTDVPGIAHAVAGLVAQASEDVLGAWLVPEPGHEVGLTAVREYCASRLPSVAMPTTIFVIHEVPVTQSGKIDRRRLRADATKTNQDA